MILSSCGGEGTTTDSSVETPVDSGPLFKQLTPAETGIDFSNNITEDNDVNYMIYDGMYQGAGAAAGDFNNDGLPDLFFTGNQVSDRLYLNKGNLKFEDITEQAGVAGGHGWSAGASLADVNGDGWLDIYVNRFLLAGDPELRRNLLYINNGDLTFTESAEAYGLADKGYSVTTTFFDVDRDGDLDAYVVNQPPNKLELKMELNGKVDYKYTDRLYRNNGDNTFTEVTKAAGIVNYAYGLSASVTDFNRDGWPDIYIACDYDEPDLFYMNNGKGQFNNVIDISMRHISTFSMGSDVADINNDGFADLMVVDMVAEDNQRIKANMSGMNPEKFWKLAANGYHYQYMFNALQLNNGNGFYSEIAQMAGVSNTDWSWSTLLADYDNDGYRDLLITNGLKRDVRNKDYEIWRKKYVGELKEKARAEGKTKLDVDLVSLLDKAPRAQISDYIFKNNGDLTFAKKSDEWGFDRKGISQGAAYADLDGDGDLDLAINTMDEPSIVYENRAIQQQRGNYLRVAFEGLYQNPKGIGAEVEIQYGNQKQFAENYTGRGYMSSSESSVHFGLGDVEQVDRVIVRWPYGKQQTFTNVAVNQVLQVKNAEATETAQYTPTMNPPLFQDVTRQTGLDHNHRENQHDDFAVETLLPHRMSTLGPSLAAGDVNGDKREDFYVGGAIGQAGELFIQQPNGTFKAGSKKAWYADANQEDMGAVFFDADNDKDLDLYVVSGGNEHEDGSLAQTDRLYLNDGKGNFKRSGNIPVIRNSGSCVTAADFDQDGDQDLFVGGRQMPGKYPFPTSSYILQNNGSGVFTDISADVAPMLENLGMVTQALWTDFNADGQLDLLIAGEWMPLTFMQNEGGLFTDVTAKMGMENTTGWWNSLAAADMDGDGDTDYIAGNLGLNIKYKASEEEPFSVFANDFDDNGVLDIVLSYYNEGTCFPLRGRQCSSDQMPFIKKKFPSYNAFAEATLEDVYGEELEESLNYHAKQFASVYLENDNGQFTLKKLPPQAQISSIYAIIPFDFDRDGNKDLLIAGNNYNREVETTRSDASIGLYMRGDGQGGFKPVNVLASGFSALTDVKDAVIVKQANGAPMVVTCSNNGPIQHFFINPSWQKPVANR